MAYDENTALRYLTSLETLEALKKEVATEPPVDLHI